MLRILRCLGPLVHMAGIAPLLAATLWAQSGQPRRRTPLTIPSIRPGATLPQVEALIGKADFDGATVHGLRSLNWHRTPMMLKALVDRDGVVASITFQLKQTPFVTDDGVTVGRDTLHVASAKLDGRLLKRSDVYAADASCFGMNVTARSKASRDWLVTYEALECGEGGVSVDKLPGSPVNNVTIARRTPS